MLADRWEAGGGGGGGDAADTRGGGVRTALEDGSAFHAEEPFIPMVSD